MSILEHPSIAGRIALLESEVEAKQNNIDSLRNDFKLLQERGIAYAELVKSTLFDAYKDGGFDEDTILHVMRCLNIDTRTTKKFEVNVTFEVEIEVPLGSNVETSALEWDVNYSVESDYHEILDYSSDVLWVTES
jgi:hypothetical protein